MVKVTIELPDSIRVPLSDTGKFTTVDVKAIASHPKQVQFAALAGWMGALNNISRGKDDKGKVNDDSAFAAMRDKRMRPWIAGADTFGSTERGESAYTAMREAWMDDFRAKTGATIKQADAFIRQSVTEAFGKDTKATFGTFIDVLAKGQVDEGEFANTDSAREAVEAYLSGLVEAAAAARAKASAKIAMPKLDLGAFKKAAK